MPSAHRNDLLQLLYECLAEINEQRPPASRFPLSETASLFGKSGGLDSLGYINFVAEIEQKIEARYQLQIMLQTSDAFAASSDPWRDVGSLADHLVARINKHVP
jgi:D-alanine--poly(phosphoribitol) ligase subunit 2